MSVAGRSHTCPQQSLETVFEGRAALAGILRFWRNAERLAKVFLVYRAHDAAVIADTGHIARPEERDVPRQTWARQRYYLLQRQGERE